MRLLTRRSPSRGRLFLGLALALALGGCSVFEPQTSADGKLSGAGRGAQPALEPPLATHSFLLDSQESGVVGQLQATYARHEDTLSDLARRFNLGYDEIVRANPGVDPWLPGEGTRIVLPTQFVLPDAPRTGIVINVAALRMFYFPKPAKGEQPVVVTHPIGIGKVGWATPVGKTKVVAKRKDPTWTPPDSVRREHAKKGDILPAVVPAGPDNPLGAYAMRLGWTSYLIHGTNKPAGVGMRVSHGCIRMYPEDIEAIFGDVPVGTPVRVVNQPVLYRWQDDSLYVQAYPPLAKKGAPAESVERNEFSDALASAMWQVAKPNGGFLELELTQSVVEEARGIAVPVSGRGMTMDSFLASARPVENVVPRGATWVDKESEVEAVDSPQPVAASDARRDR